MLSKLSEKETDWLIVTTWARPVLGLYFKTESNKKREQVHVICVNSCSSLWKFMFLLLYYSLHNRLLYFCYRSWGFRFFYNIELNNNWLITLVSYIEFSLTVGELAPSFSENGIYNFLYKNGLPGLKHILLSLIECYTIVLYSIFNNWKLTSSFLVKMFIVYNIQISPSSHGVWKKGDILDVRNFYWASFGFLICR